MALQSLLINPIVYVLASFDLKIRKKHGWKSMDLTNLNVIEMASKSWFQQSIGIFQKYPDAIHVFGGFWVDRRFFLLIAYAIWKRIRVVVMNEAYSTDTSGYLLEQVHSIGWLKVKLRPLLYSGAAKLLQLLGRGNEICLLAISHQAVEQFDKANF